MRTLTCLVLLGLLTACASAPAPVPPDAPAARRGSSTATTPALPAPAVTPAAVTAVDALLVEARRLREAGDLDASLGRLERALRIAPERAAVYLELALTHRAAGSAERSAATAERGLLFCRDRECDALKSLAGR